MRVRAVRPAAPLSGIAPHERSANQLCWLVDQRSKSLGYLGRVLEDKFPNKGSKIYLPTSATEVLDGVRAAARVHAGAIVETKLGGTDDRLSVPPPLFGN